MLKKCNWYTKPLKEGGENYSQFRGVRLLVCSYECSKKLKSYILGEE